MKDKPTCTKCHDKKKLIVHIFEWGKPGSKFSEERECPYCPDKDPHLNLFNKLSEGE